MPRLRGKGIELSRLGGGIGTRGPGETKLEVDKRRIKLRIAHLKKELAKVKRRRENQRKKRKKSGIITISLIGYTNAGKSTLLNALTKSKVFVEDKLFATLDSTTRKLYFSQGYPVVISDTVGFIQKLPHLLIAAFRSTLDEVRHSNLLLHVIDASSPNFESQINAVQETLSEIGASQVPQIEIFNKIDLISSFEIRRLHQRFPQGIFISALKSINLKSVLFAIETRLAEKGIIKLEKKPSAEKIYKK